MAQKKIIIGLGSGRSGTQSLVALLNKYPDTKMDHEKFPIDSTWLPNMKYFNTLCRYFDNLDERIVGDVSFYNLPYFYLFKERYNDIKFICLKRDKEATIASYMKKTDGRNHFSFPNAENEHRLWDKKYPKFLGASKQQGLSNYYDHYYGQVAYLQHVFPDEIRTFKLEDLNSLDGIRQIFKFLGLKEKYIDDSYTHIKSNTIEETKTEFRKTRQPFLSKIVGHFKKD